MKFGPHFPRQRRPILFGKCGLQLHFPAALDEIPRGHQRIAAIVTLAEKNHRPARERAKLSHAPRDFSARLFHQRRGCNALGEGTLLERFHFAAIQNHGIQNEWS